MLTATLPEVVAVVVALDRAKWPCATDTNRHRHTKTQVSWKFFESRFTSFSQNADSEACGSGDRFRSQQAKFERHRLSLSHSSPPTMLKTAKETISLVSVSSADR